MGGPVKGALDQQRYRFRDDDGNEAAATWRQNANTDDTQLVDTVYRVRFVLEETAGGAKNNADVQFEHQKNGGGWVDTTVASINIQAIASQLVNGNDCTQQESAGAFVATNAGQCEDGLAGGATNDFAGNDFGEYELSYWFQSINVADGDTLDIRVKGLASYSVADATITVDKPAVGRRVFVVS